MRSDPYAVVRQFEQAVAAYTGAPFCVAVNSCTMALLLAVKWAFENLQHVGNAWVNIPKRTYVSVPMSIMHAGGWPTFRDETWSGAYQLKPYPIWDAARRFYAGMYETLAKRSHFTYVCTSFHASKILGDTQGGAILHNDPDADAWFRKARFDGRSEGVAPKDDDIDVLGYHCYLSPDVAALLLLKLHSLPQHNPDLPNDDYPDLSTLKVFQR